MQCTCCRMRSSRPRGSRSCTWTTRAPQVSSSCFSSSSSTAPRFIRFNTRRFSNLTLDLERENGKVTAQKSQAFDRRSTHFVVVPATGGYLLRRNATDGLRYRSQIGRCIRTAIPREIFHPPCGAAFFFVCRGPPRLVVSRRPRVTERWTRKRERGEREGEAKPRLIAYRPFVSKVLPAVRPSFLRGQFVPR